MIFGDESGCQTNQKKDGNVGNTAHIVERGTVPWIMCSTNDHRFTILPFTSASGGVVCCVIICTSSVKDGVPLLWKTGVDVRIDNPVKINGMRLILD